MELLAALALDAQTLGYPGISIEGRRAVSRCRGSLCGAVLWLESRSDGGLEQILEVVQGVPGAWGELLVSSSSDWDYREDLYANDLYLSGFAVSCSLAQETIYLTTGVAPAAAGILKSLGGTSLLTLTPEDNPSGYFVVSVPTLAEPVAQWHEF